MYETILFEVDKGVGWLTLNRPDKLNAFTELVNKEVLDALKKPNVMTPYGHLL